MIFDCFYCLNTGVGLEQWFSTFLTSRTGKTKFHYHIAYVCKSNVKLETSFECWLFVMIRVIRGSI